MPFLVRLVFSMLTIAIFIVVRWLATALPSWFITIGAMSDRLVHSGILSLLFSPPRRLLAIGVNGRVSAHGLVGVIDPRGSHFRLVVLRRCAPSPSFGGMVPHFLPSVPESWSLSSSGTIYAGSCRRHC